MPLNKSSFFTDTLRSGSYEEQGFLLEIASKLDQKDWNYFERLLDEKIIPQRALIKHLVNFTFSKNAPREEYVDEKSSIHSFINTRRYEDKETDISLAITNRDWTRVDTLLKDFDFNEVKKTGIRYDH